MGKHGKLTSSVDGHVEVWYFRTHSLYIYLYISLVHKAYSRILHVYEASHDSQHRETANAWSQSLSLTQSKWQTSASLICAHLPLDVYGRFTKAAYRSTRSAKKGLCSFGKLSTCIHACSHSYGSYSLFSIS